MTVWLLIVLAVKGAEIQGAALVATFASEDICIQSRQTLPASAIRNSRCVEVSLGEDA